MFENLETELELMGARLADVVRIKTYVAFPRDVEKYNEVFRERFATIKPAHTVVGSWDFPLPQAAVELDATAVIGGRAQSLASDGLPDILGPAGAGVLADGFHYATALPIDAEGKSAGRTTQDQIVATLANLGRMLSVAELSVQDVCNLHATLADIRDVPHLEEGLRKFFGGTLPSLTVVGAPLERAEFRVTMESIACKGGGQRLGSNRARLTPGKAAPAVLAKDTLFLSGQIGVVATAEDGGGVTDQANEAWAKLHELVAAAGFAPDSMLRTNNILTDWRDYSGFNAGYGANVNEPYVPRATVLGQLSDTRARVQIEGIAHRLGAGATILQVPPVVAR
jgi:enamine deaminase RidA (YjgF/YER057c/UK114 family)